MAEKKLTHSLSRPWPWFNPNKEGTECTVGKIVLLAVVVVALVWSWPNLSEGAGFALVQ
jgi:hypothetical protein